MQSWDDATKRVLVLFGSPHKNGTTAELVKSLQNACPSHWQWHFWFGFDNPPVPCDDCGFCRGVAGCSKPDLDDHFDRLEEADILIFATPVYNLSFSAPLKILLDRTQRYWAARFVRGEKPPIARPKKAVLLSVGEKDFHAGEMLLAQLKPTLTILNATLVSSLHILSSYSADDSEQALLAMAAGLQAYERTPI